MSGRIRTVKPEWLEDERLVLASEGARVLSVALIVLADDQGRGRYVPQIMSARIFPRNPGIFPGTFAELEEMGFVVAYRVDGQGYWQIRNWERHQRVDKPAKARIPEYLDDSQEFPGFFPGNSRLTPTPTPTPTPTTDHRPADVRLETAEPEKQRIKDPLGVKFFIARFNEAATQLGGAPALPNSGLDPWRADRILETCRLAKVDREELLGVWFLNRNRKTHTLAALDDSAPQLVEQLSKQEKAS